METQELKNQFEQILLEVKHITGMSDESATHVASLILKEAGKDRRAMLLSTRSYSNRSLKNGQPATFKQKNYLSRLGIRFTDDITKSEASDLIDKANEQSDSND